MTSTEQIIPAGGARLVGDLELVEGSESVVLFAHGSGSGRFSPRNRAVAQALNAAGHGTLLIDLLTEEEEAYDERTRALRFDIDLLARRLTAAVDWLAWDLTTHGMAIGLFGASTGAAAALVAASARPDLVRAVVSRGGRPDLAGPALRNVQSPTLLIVGGWDDVVLELNRRALVMLPAEKHLEVVPGAGHLFEEPGALDRVSQLAADWFSAHLQARKHDGGSRRHA